MQNQITDYTILSITLSKGDETLIQLVNDKIAEGWQPFGGITLSSGAGGGGLSQAMVKYAELSIDTQ